MESYYTQTHANKKIADMARLVTDHLRQKYLIKIMLLLKDTITKISHKLHTKYHVKTYKTQNKPEMQGKFKKITS